MRITLTSSVPFTALALALAATGCRSEERCVGEYCSQADPCAEDPSGANCQTGYCGDGVVASVSNPADPRFEECDDGPTNSDTEPNACRTDCTKPSCGDGVFDDTAPCGVAVRNANRYPTRLAYGPRGRLYVTDHSVSSLFIYDDNLQQVAEIPELQRPLGIAVHTNGDVYVGSDGRDEILQFDAYGTFIRSFGQRRIEKPNDLVLDAAGNLYVADSSLGLVRVFDSNGNFLRDIGAGKDSDRLRFPTALALAESGNSGELFVAEQGQFRVRVYDLQGRFLRDIGSAPTDDDWRGHFVKVQSLAHDGQGHLHAVDTYYSNVQVFDATTGEYLYAYGTRGSEQGELNVPLDIAITQAGVIAVANAENHRVELIGTATAGNGQPDTAGTQRFAMARTAKAWAGAHATADVQCIECHSIHGGTGLVPRGESQETVCKSCHNPTGQASTMHQVALHVVKGGDTVIDCGSCHNPHGPSDSADHAGTVGTNLSLIRDDIAKYRPGALEPAVFQTKPDHFAFSQFDEPWNGICQTCHTETRFHTNDNSAPHNHNINTDCTNCHRHENGFLASMGPTHTTHLTAPNGPAMGCESGDLGCHGANEAPTMGDGQDLANTTVCNECHSPGGTYDGVNDPVFGAKANWTEGVYDATGAVMFSKAMWCSGCHDDAPSVIDTIAAPNVIGNETSGSYYGTGYGFYVTGHGAPNTQSYPASGGYSNGAGLRCTTCHDPQLAHIDGTHRTFDKDAALDSAGDYRNGYRLRLVGGEQPLVVPRHAECDETPEVKDSDFRLCLLCHNRDRFVNEASTASNYRHTGYNAHFEHLAINDGCGWEIVSSDWSSTNWDARATCVTCHNVHGSTQLAMIRDGKLVDREPGLQIVYHNSSVSYQCGGPLAQEPTPKNVTLPNSTGAIFNAGSINGSFCMTCHGSCGWDKVYTRTPIDAFAPFLSAAYGAVGSRMIAVQFSEGVFSEQGANGALAPKDFDFTGWIDNRTVTKVAHTPGASVAWLTLNAPINALNELGLGSLATAASNAIFDSAGNSAKTTKVVPQPETPQH